MVGYDTVISRQDAITGHEQMGGLYLLPGTK